MAPDSIGPPGFAEPVIGSLVERCETVLAKSHKPRVLITIAGIPGSGKTTLATAVAKELNRHNPGCAVAVGMDGFHYTRAHLDHMPDPERAHKYRGAPFTFDAQGVVDKAFELATNTATDVKCPTFDHKLKDPVQNGTVVGPSVRYVLFEGLYLQLKDEPWNRIGKIADDTWFVDTPLQIARDRLAKRHVASGIVSTLEQGRERADFNDIPNGKYIIANSEPAAFKIMD